MDLISWLARYFRGSYDKKSWEVNFPCPRCKHPSFYFNIKKKLGYCHRDRCHWKPSLDDLVKIVGKGPEDSFVGPISSTPTPVSDVGIKLPEGSQALVRLEDGEIVTDFPLASQEITKTRHIDAQSQLIFQFHVGNGRIYIPVFYEDKMVSYVGRAMWWLPLDIPRYKYPSGSKIANYLFNWQEAKQWPQLTLVENTFNAIWLRDMQVTTNFGSHLSDSQIEKILQSRAAKEGTILLMWDQGADKNAMRAVNKLRLLGYNAAYVQLTGQPDDHSLESINQMILEGHAAAAENKFCLDYRTET